MGALKWGLTKATLCNLHTIVNRLQLCTFVASPNGGSQMGAQGQTLQFARNRVQLCTFVGPSLRGELSSQNDDNCSRIWTPTLNRESPNGGSQMGAY